MLRQFDPAWSQHCPNILSADVGTMLPPFDLLLMVLAYSQHCSEHSLKKCGLMLGPFDLT